MKKESTIKIPLYYHYYNCNPKHKLTDDCVIRAICSSTGDSWEDTIRALTEWSIKTGYMLNTPECYGKYLESIGYVKQKQPTTANGKKVRFQDFCKKFDGHAICHCGKSHVTYVADNSVWAKPYFKRFRDKTIRLSKDCLRVKISPSKQCYKQHTCSKNV